MVKNYIKTALRNLLKNKLTSFINIFGLALAIGCSLVVYVFIDWEYNMDSFHENRREIYLVTNVVSRDGRPQEWGDSPSPIGAMLQQDFPQVDRVVRIDGRSGIFRYQDKVFREFIHFADSGFMDMFSYELEWGDRNALKDPSKIILSKRIADKYFGQDNPVGKQITLTYGERVLSFEVGAVSAKFPGKSSMNYNALINYERIKDADLDVSFDDWADFISATFLQIKDKNDVATVAAGMDKYVALQNAADQDWPASAYPVRAFDGIFVDGHEIRGTIMGSNDPYGRMILGTIGVFMILLACFNYINISIVSATKRLKEIGIRKVIGGNRKMIIFQFLAENLIITFFALMLGLLFAWSMFVPWFDKLFTIGLTLDLTGDLNIWIYLLAVLLITGLASGAYPAFYISSFQAVSIFRGKHKFGGKNLFTRIFLTFQFILSLITIVSGILFVQNGEYQREKDWGYNQEQTIVVPVIDEATYVQYKNVVAQHPDITSVVGSANHLGRSAGLSVVDIHGEKHEFRRLDVGNNYVETMELRLLQGRNFDENLETDFQQSVLINQNMINAMEWEEPIGKTFTYDSTDYFVIGVLEDFHYYDFWEEIQPTFLRLIKEDTYRYLSVKVAGGKATETAEYLETTWKKEFPDLPYYGFYQNEVFSNYFEQLSGHGKIMAFTAALAVILSCMGLFGLVSLTVASKMKDFSIQKVLGAGISTIVSGVNRQFIWLLLIATVLGGPISYFLMSALFDVIYPEYHMPIEVLSIAFAILLMFLTAFVTVSSQVYKVLATNPVDSLRTE